ncbi:MAG: peptide chain release factor N(5)-glutamine methyltransferase [Eubacteriales bacterium]|nr:peptide chain release factor N(5)-glutamine methyltransferase [Eubacteriales bacterium]
MKTYNDIYMNTRTVLRQRGIEAFNQEARYIVAAAAGKTVEELLRDMKLYASNQIEERVLDYTARRLRGEPVAYITGTWEFYGLPIITNSNVLIPRVDTEVLVEQSVELLMGKKMNARILDLCCGSGCITCALAHELPATRLMAIDISANALEVCRQNLTANRLSSRVLCMQTDVLSAPPLGIGEFDMIVANPPYIASGELNSLDPSVKDYEPIWALDGGEDGLKFYRAIIKYWKALLPVGGYMVFEVGEGQAEPVREMLSSAGFDETGTKKDTLGIDRVVYGKM